MTARLPPLLTELDLPLAELTAARLDAELYPIGAGFAPVDEFETLRHRARSLKERATGRLIAEQFTAAWVWGAVPLFPAQLQFCASLDARVTRTTHAWCATREVVIDESEWVRIDCVGVTTPLRTAVDIARFSPTFDPFVRSALRELMTIGQFGYADCLDELGRRRNLPAKRRAAERLAAA